MTSGKSPSFSSVAPKRARSEATTSGQAHATPNPPPMLGEHTDEVLAEYGLDQARISELRANGVVSGGA